MESENFRQAPVVEGDELDVVIEAVGAKGDGVAKKDGFVIFVPGTKEGDKVRIKITKVLEKISFSELIDGMAEPKEKVEETPVDTEDFGEDLERDDVERAE